MALHFEKTPDEKYELVFDYSRLLAAGETLKDCVVYVNDKEIVDSYVNRREQYDMGAAVKRINRPLLIIHGSLDAIPASDARRLYENANDPKRLEIVEGGSHTFVDTGHLGKIIGLSIGWFDQYLQ